MRLSPFILLLTFACNTNGGPPVLYTGDTGGAGGDGGFGNDPTLDADNDGDGYTPNEGDCDDEAESVNPGAAEICDSIDNDCDALVDEYDATDATEWYRDIDGDGFGDDADATTDCAQPTGYEAVGGDCDDANNTVHPDAIEVCDGIDNDCNGEVDDGPPEGATTWYEDADGDGYGDADTSELACDASSGWVADATDCDDSDEGINPGAGDWTEDEVDDDCDGDIDEDASCNAYLPFGLPATAVRTYSAAMADGTSFTEIMQNQSWAPSTGRADIKRTLTDTTGASYAVVESYACDGRDVAMTGYTFTDGTLTSLAISFSTARGVMPDEADLIEDATWEFDYRALDSVMGAMWQTAGSSTVIGPSTITTSAGDFDTMVIETTYTLTDLSGYLSDIDRGGVITAHYAQGVGLVYSEDINVDTGATTELRELTGYTGFTP